MEEHGKWRAARRYVVWLALATAGLFGFAELALWAAGVLPANALEDPYTGFTRTYPLFEPSEAGSRTLQTAEDKLRFFNYQSFAREKGPGTVRIFCLGGSTTFGRPYADATSYCGWLRELLPAADPDRGWEVINAGGISYASYRIAVLMEELIRYEPDAFIIYTGHNEFLEARTYGTAGEDIRALARVRAVAGHTRLYTLAKRWTGGPARRAVEGAVLPSEVHTRLDQSVGPSDYHRAMLHREETLAHFRFNVNRMIALAEGVGAQVLLVTPASNLRDCSPFKSEGRARLSDGERATLEGLHRQADEAIAREDWSGAGIALEKSLAIDGCDALRWYRWGRVQEALGDFSGARMAYGRARDEDICPLRAPGVFVEAIREIARERDVALMDVEEQFSALAADGIPGRDLFLDHVHPTLAGHREIAVALVRSLEGTLEFDIPEDFESRVLPDVERRITDALGVDEEAGALRNLAQVLSWAGKYEEARHLAESCIALRPDDAEAHALRGWTAEHGGAAEVAISSYRTALDLNPDHLLAIRRLLPLLIANGEMDEARRRCEEALRRRPADVELREIGTRLLISRPS